MEFCKLVFCYNDDPELLNKSENLRNKNEYLPCSCGSGGQIIGLGQYCACSDSETKFLRKIETCTCICKSGFSKIESKYRKEDKSTITNKNCCECQKGRKCLKREKNILHVEKATSTDEPLCTCCSKNHISKNIIVSNSEEQYMDQNSNEPCSCGCICSDERQTPTKETKVLKDKNVSTVNISANRGPILRSNSRSSSKVSQKSISSKLSPCPSEVVKGNLPTKSTSTSKLRHVCFCPEPNSLIQDETAERSKSGSKDFSEITELSSLKSESLNETTSHSRSTGTLTRSTIGTRSKIVQVSQISENVLGCEKLGNKTNQEIFPNGSVIMKPQRSILIKPLIDQSNCDLVKSSDKKVAKSQKSRKMSSKQYLVSSTNDLIKICSCPLRQSSIHSSEISARDSDAQKPSTKVDGTMERREASTNVISVQQEEQVSSRLCQCCQAIFKSPSAPCVGTSTQRDSNSVKSRSTSIQSIEPRSVTRVSPFETDSFLLETNDLEAVHEEDAMDDNQDVFVEEDMEEVPKKDEYWNKNVKENVDNSHCDLQERFERFNAAYVKSREKSKPTKRKTVWKEITVTKEDIDIIDEYFKDRYDEEESANSIKYGSFKYHYLMKDIPCATIEIKEGSLRGQDVGTEYNFLMLDEETSNTSLNKNTMKGIAIRSFDSGKSPEIKASQISQNPTEKTEKSPDHAVNEETKERRDSERSERFSINDRVRLSEIRRESGHNEEFVKENAPGEEEMQITDSTWMGPNQGLSTNMETYDSLERMVIDKLKPGDHHYSVGTKEPISVFEEILKEEKRKFNRNSMTSQRSATRKSRDQRSSRFFDFFRGWMTHKSDTKKKHDNLKRRKSITIRESDDEIISQTPSETSADVQEGSPERRRTSLNAYKSRPFPNVAPAQQEGYYSAGS
ncbi:uncharacterized protein LOC130900991 isoform X2 [Diorhabda carinulata]|uniref:uncharacterized protein LOC130900991 isoform X2 n=1 Tax=Diorhabda carinulata TaxID=1163345 RepID=UPI0025A07A3A|nr:uncharacterized protein LOC130900991 isoform X2 [Diorhabda carinulata]